MEREIVSSATECRYKMILPGLDCFFCYVASMIVRWYELICHVGGGDSGFVGCQDFVVKHLVSWCYATGLHACKCSGSGKDELAFCFIFSGFYPDGVAVDVVEYHLVLKPSAGDVLKLTHLIGVQCVLGVVGFDVDIVLLRQGCW